MEEHDVGGISEAARLNGAGNHPPVYIVSTAAEALAGAIGLRELGRLGRLSQANGHPGHCADAQDALEASEATQMKFGIRLIANEIGSVEARNSLATAEPFMPWVGWRRKRASDYPPAPSAKFSSASA